MAIVIVDVPPTYDMLSRHWGTYVGGRIQFDPFYDIIPMFGGDTHCVYREIKMTYTLSYLKIPSSFPSYSLKKLGITFLVKNHP